MDHSYHNINTNVELDLLLKLASDGGAVLCIEVGVDLENNI